MSETENEETTEIEETNAVEAPAADEAVAASDAEAGSAGAEATDAQPEGTVAEGDHGEPTAEQSTPIEKKKRKRLPRALRPQKGRVRRERATERKPISREAKPEHERGRHQERRGVVVSDAMDKTIVVKVDVIKSHSRYKKVIRRSVKFHAHDERNEAHVGDVVRIVETRPLSKTKRWRLVEVLEVAK
jgi:small subunit ribosomal protein S17